MRLSKSTELALHSLWQLAHRTPELLLVSDMAGKQHVSESYLAKIFQKLAREGLVRSTRGKHGGFALAKKPDQITLASIIRAVETRTCFFECQDRSRRCRGKKDCFVRNIFKDAEERMLTVLEGTTLADIMARSPLDPRSSWLN